MIKESLGKILRKIFYVLFAVVISVSIWVYVELTENVVQDTDISNIAVVLGNEDILNDRGLMIIEHEIETISIRVEASLNVRNALSVPGALTAVVDLSNVTSAGNTTLSYEFNWPDGVSENDLRIISQSVIRIPLRIGRQIERSVPVRVVYTGGTAPGYIAEEPEFDPQIITIRGAEELISGISYVRVPIPRENLSTTFTDYLPFLLYDEQDNEIILEYGQLEQITFNHEAIRVTVPISEVKEIPLTVTLVHGNSTMDANTSVEIIPSTIMVSGDPDILRDLNYINLGPIDMVSFETNTFETFTIIVPDNVRNISGDIRADVYVEVIGLIYQFRNVTNFQLINTPPGLSAEPFTQTLTVMIRGTNEDLAEVTSLNMLVVADLDDISPGVTQVPVTVSIIGLEANVDVIGEHSLAVSVTRDVE